MKRTTLVLLFLVLIATTLFANKKPNIILVFADDLGIGDLSCYGQMMTQTPNLDKMAREGIRFTNFYTGTPVCSPSRCNLMTGMHAGHAEIRHNQNDSVHGQIPLSVNAFTMATMLKNEGYATGCFGKWALGVPGNSGDPMLHGFDNFYGYYCQCYAHNSFPPILWKNGDTIQLRNEIVPVKVNFCNYPLSYSSKKLDFAPELYFKEALNFIETNREKPFFLYFATTLPHNNGEAPESEKHEVPDLGIYKDKNWTVPEKSYAAMVTLLDTQMGILFEKLKKEGLDKNTIVIFTSDNGASFNSPNMKNNGTYRGRKSTLYEGGIREPMIVRWPERIKAGSTCEMPCATYDIMPTLAEITGAKIPVKVDGRSMLKSLKGKKQKQADFLYWEYYSGDRSPVQAIRQGDWKLLRFNFLQPEKQEIELYHLASDPEEKNNLVQNNSLLVSRLLSILDKEHSDYKHFISE